VSTILDPKSVAYSAHRAEDGGVSWEAQEHRGGAREAREGPRLRRLCRDC